MTPAEIQQAAQKRRKAKRERVLPVAVVVLALLMGGQYVYLLSGVTSRAQCQADFRGKLGAASDDNQNRLILGVASLTVQSDPGQEPTKAERERLEREYRSLFTTFTAEAQRISAERQALAEGKVCQ